MTARVEITESELCIFELSLDSKDAVAFLLRVPEPDRVATIKRAIEVGLFCLERGQNAQDMEFVKRQIGLLMASVDEAVSGIPGRTERALLEKIGTENGQVLSPVKNAVDQAARETKQRLEEVKGVLANDLDPSKSSTVLGAALAGIRALIDPKRTDSVQFAISTAVEKVTQPDGALAATVRETVSEAIKPLKDEVDRLSAQIRGQEMVEDALENTPAKGPKYEEEVASTLQQWAKFANAQIERVGIDNQPGDFVVEFAEVTGGPEDLRVVVEARDRSEPWGRQKISQDLAAKFRQRQAHAGIYVSKTSAGLAREVGDWAVGQCESGPWVACTNENLVTALRYIVVQQQLKRMKESQPEIDSGAIEAQAEAVRVSLGRLRTINTKVTGLKDIATCIESESNSLRAEISASLSAIQDAMRNARKPTETMTIQIAASAAQAG